MKKKKMHPVLRILCFLFICYSALYLMMKTGYHQKSMQDKVFTTSEQISKFEEDILNGKQVDAVSYLPKREDYSNVYTKAAVSLSKRIGKILGSKSKNVFDFFKALFLP